MLKAPSIAVDVMTSERGINAVLTAVCNAAKQCPHIRFHLVGDRLLIEESLESLHRLTWRSLNLEIHHTDIVIEHNDDPVWALKHRHGSSTHKALTLVKDNIADAAVSCANTGALGAISRYVLKRLPGVDKLAMVGSFPTYRPATDVYICDVGASYDASAEQLHSFATMATAMMKSESSQRCPRVALLNIGTESSKGNVVVRQAFKLLTDDPTINFIGFLEGHDIFSGQADILVCDGFVGNCLLKSCEGTANFIMTSVKKACLKSAYSRFVGGLLKGILKSEAPSLNPSLRNGALILGLNGIVIKSHGNADVLGIETSIHTAIKAATSAYAGKLSTRTVSEQLDVESVMS